MKTKEQKLADIDASIKRWLSRIRRATNAIHKLEQRRVRLLKPRDPMRVGKMSPVMAKALEIRDYDAIETQAKAICEVERKEVAGLVEVLASDTDIPTFLKRDPNADALKKMNERIEKRAGQHRREKPVKSPLLAKAIADNNRRNSPKT